MDNRQKLEKYLRKYGKYAMSYSTLQDGLFYHIVDNHGYVAYAKSESKDPIIFSLSNPVCKISDYYRITEQFLTKHPNAVFMQITEEFAQVLDKFGYHINQFGFETEIDIANFSYKGRKKEDLRRGFNKTEADLDIIELKENDNYSNDLEQITNDWLKGKIVNKHEIWFAARKANYDYEKDVRKFVAIGKQNIEGYVFFDPMYDNNKIFGYLSGILRARRSSPDATLRLITKKAMDIFRNEGIKVISLGLNPFALLKQDKFTYDSNIKMTFEHLYENENKLYNFKNLFFTKSRYGGGVENNDYRDKNVRMKPVYFAQKFKDPNIPIQELFKLIGIV